MALHTCWVAHSGRPERDFAVKPEAPPCAIVLLFIIMPLALACDIELFELRSLCCRCFKFESEFNGNFITPSGVQKSRLVKGQAFAKGLN